MVANRHENVEGKSNKNALRSRLLPPIDRPFPQIILITITIAAAVSTTTILSLSQQKRMMPKGLETVCGHWRHRPRDGEAFNKLSILMASMIAAVIMVNSKNVKAPHEEARSLLRRPTRIDTG
jgi:hypothetical protein